MTIFTMGFTKKSAQTFFELIKANNITALLDIRLNNSSQLAGFSKGCDLNYFLRELCNCSYRYEPIFAPTKALMDSAKSKTMTLRQFEAAYLRLMEERNTLSYFETQYATCDSVCLLCSEDTPEICHRRVLAEMIAGQYPHAAIRHL
ncbi:MAG: DUF488 domain-containing protein [Clostridiales bacterium]|nr:DUF488 domain-containing protein [Clostridiales bacterium]